MAKGKNLLGIDIGASSIKACLLKETKRGLQLQSFDQVEIPFRERGEPRLVPVQERVGRGAREDGQGAAEAPATLPDATL